MGNIQRAILNEIARKVRLENCRLDIEDRRTTTKIKHDLVELQKELRSLKNELAEVQKTVSGTARPRRAMAPKIDATGIRRLRKKHGLTIREFGAVLGVSLETISRWENNKQRIRPAHKKAIVDLRPLGKKAIKKMLAEKQKNIIEENESGSSLVKSPMAQLLLQSDEE